MHSPFSGLVLGSGALLASPALWAAFVDQTMSEETALVRLGVAVLVAWVGLSLLQSLLAGTAEPLADAGDPGETGDTGARPMDGAGSVRGTVVEPPEPHAG